MARVTLKDVAREAGLSVTQVSRALNGHYDVAEATRALAERVASELNYIPNTAARRLQDPGARTGSIGVFLPSDSIRFSDPFFGDLMSAMVLEASEHGFHLQLSTPPKDTPRLIAPYDAAIRSNSVDGFVLLRTLIDDPRATFLLERDFPFVTFGRPRESSGLASVDTTRDAFAPAIRHLRELGHDRIACLAEPPQFAISARRLESFLAALASETELAGEPTVLVAGFREDDGHRATMELLMAQSERPTAIVALNDLLALGALRASEDLGLSVPGDLSIVGFDDVDAARLVSPSLTTMRQSAAEVGAALIEELRPLIDLRSAKHAERQITPSLVIRESTGPAHS